MGSVGVDEQGLTQADAHPFKHYTIDGLFSPSETCLPTALRADVLLTSWLIVLMRTREERQASFEWAYDGWEDEAVHQRTARRLTTDEVLPGLDLDSPLADAIQRTSRNHASGVKDLCTETACPKHLLLSTGSLSTTSSDEQDEVSGASSLVTMFQAPDCEIRRLQSILRCGLTTEDSQSGRHGTARRSCHTLWRCMWTF